MSLYFTENRNSAPRMALYLNTDNLHDLSADSSWDDKRDTEALLYLEIARDCWSRANPNA